MRVALLYICTGRYVVFWPGFFESCEKFFLNDAELHYFVFTDAELENSDDQRVHKVYQQVLGWPDDTLKRFHLFAKIKAELESYDYIFFFNANVVFCSHIGQEILPSADEQIVVVQHPGYYHRKRSAFTYENNPGSLAYVPPGEGDVYVCGGVNGGIAEFYINMIDSLREAIDTDEKNGVMAVWHDESHINKYILGHPYKLLSPAYCSPEDFYLPFDEKIIVLNKDRFGGHSFLRKISPGATPVQLFKRWIVNLPKVLRHKIVRTAKLIVDAMKYEGVVLSRFFSKRYGKLHFDVDSSVFVTGYLHRHCEQLLAPRNLFKLLSQDRIAANSIEAIYACYVLNLLEAVEAENVIRRWYMLLRSGGELRLSFPDPEKAINIELGSDFKYFFSYAEMEEILLAVGFRSVSVYQNVPHFGNSAFFSEPMHEIVDRSLLRDADRKFVSVNVVAYK